MRLIYRIIIRLSVVLSIILTLWAVFFYIAIIDQVNDEIDDSLEDYSEHIMMRALAGEELPAENDNSNNQFYLTEVSSTYAQNRPHVNYKDSMVYIPFKKDIEPARVLTTIYRNTEGQYYELIVLTPTIEKNDLREAILYWIIFLYACLLIIIILSNVWIYTQSFRPLYKLLKWMDGYRIEEENIPLDNSTDIKEFKKLNEVVVKSFSRTKEAFEEQKKFIGNASHEVQTPLAVCRNRIENLMDDGMLTESQLKELDKVHQTLVYITKLNKTLLLLAKIENMQFIDKKNININSTIKKIAADYQEIYAYKNINIDTKELAEYYVYMSENLAVILFNNLIKNSCIHNIEDGLVQIEISDKRIIIRNTGQPMPLDSSSIFKRFIKGSQRDDSTGLGLSLVKSICEIEKLHIDYYFKQGLHCFEIYR